MRSITLGERDGVVKSDCLRARNSGVTIYLWNKPNTFTSDRIESKKMEIFFDYLPCRIRCSIFAYQFSLWNGSNPKKTSHYFRRSYVEKRRTISYKNVLEKKKKKKKKVFFLRVFILLLSPLILPKYISKLMKRAGWTPGFQRRFHVFSPELHTRFPCIYAPIYRWNWADDDDDDDDVT